MISQNLVTEWAIPYSFPSKWTKHLHWKRTVCILTLKKNNNKKIRTLHQILPFFILIIYALQFTRVNVIPMTFFFFFERMYIKYLPWIFPSISSLLLSISIAIYFYWSLCMVPSSFSYIKSKTCIQFLIEPKLVFPTKAVLFLENRMKLSDLNSKFIWMI